MTPELIRELLTLRGWKPGELARRMEMSENAVWKWLAGAKPIGAANVLMRAWLKKAKRQTKSKARRNGVHA